MNEDIIIFNQLEGIKIFKRLCPSCNKELIYKTKGALKTAADRNSKCLSCSVKGENNGFYGKKHSNEVLDKISINTKKVMQEKFSGENAPMYNKTFYEIWIEKYGKEEADLKLIEYKKKQSINSSGENNPMFGKPAPKGSGNGWSGWYEGFFFRSLMELSFIIDNLDKISTAESKKYKIEYELNGVKRNYFPDFIIENKIIEIKPQKLWKTLENSVKFEKAKIWANENGYEFLILDYPKKQKSVIQNLVTQEKIKFTNRYKIKYDQYKQ